MHLYAPSRCKRCCVGSCTADFSVFPFLVRNRCPPVVFRLFALHFLRCTFCMFFSLQILIFFFLMLRCYTPCVVRLALRLCQTWHFSIKYKYHAFLGKIKHVGCSDKSPPPLTLERTKSNKSYSVLKVVDCTINRFEYKSYTGYHIVLSKNQKSHNYRHSVVASVVSSARKIVYRL